MGLIDTVARREDKFPLGCEIILDLARKVGWQAEKTITDKGTAAKIGVLEKDYDVIGFSLYHQLQYFNIVPILHSFSIPLLTYDRKKGDPIVCAGGAAVTSNPFPVADFFDFILLGDAEEVFPQILKLYSNSNKDRFLRKLNESFDSVLVPKYPRERYKVAQAVDISSGILPPAEGRHNLRLNLQEAVGSTALSAYNLLFHTERTLSLQSSLSFISTRPKMYFFLQTHQRLILSFCLSWIIASKKRFIPVGFQNGFPLYQYLSWKR